MQMGGVVSVVIAVTIAAIIGVTVGIGVVGDVVGDNTGTQSVTNESVTGSLEYNTTYDLDGFEVVSGSQTVYVENGSAGSFESLASSEYTLDERRGELEVTGQTGSSSGDEVKITYDYEATDGTATTILDLLTLFIALIILVFVARPLMGLA